MIFFLAEIIAVSGLVLVKLNYITFFVAKMCYLSSVGRFDWLAEVGAFLRRRIHFALQIVQCAATGRSFSRIGTAAAGAATAFFAAIATITSSR